MARYTTVLGDDPHIEALPRGTSRKDGMTFVEAKAEIRDYCRKSRDGWANAYRLSAKLSRTNLTLESVAAAGGAETADDADETSDEETEE